MEKGARIYETPFTDIQSRDQINASYQDTAKRCSHAIEVMLKVGTSKDMVIDVIRDLIANIIN